MHWQGKGVHVVTVNDYLATRDSEWMGRVYRFLGLRVGLVVQGMSPQAKQEAYAADITYGTNNEFGFDYLRDNMCFHRENMVQRPLHYCIVDEVDSILIDEARTPLIISGPAGKPAELCTLADRPAKSLKCLPPSGVACQGGLMTPYLTVITSSMKRPGSAALTQEGVAKMERALGVENLYGPRANTDSARTTSTRRSRATWY